MTKKKTVPKKLEEHHHAVQGLKSIKGGFKGAQLFKYLYGREGNKKEVQTLLNRLNSKRANPGLDILGEFVEKLPHLHDMTLGDFFNLKKKE